MAGNISKIDPHNQQQLRRQLGDMTSDINQSTADIATNTAAIAALNSSVSSMPIVQGGHTGTISTSGTAITFPTPFPTACTSVVATDDRAGGSARIMSVTAISTTGFTIFADGSGDGAYWIAMGS